MNARVAALYRYPVKSMGGGEVARVAVGPGGFPGDRGWALRLAATGRPASAKRFAALMMCRARYLDEPAPGRTPPPAEVELPDGSRTRTDDPRANGLLSRFLGVETAFSSEENGEGHFDDLPLHVISTATLATMRGKTSLDFAVKRFRPNVLIEADEAGRPEDAWTGGIVRVGGVATRIVKPVDRCVMTTLPQPGLSQEKGVLTAVVQDGGALGVYAQALAEGIWSVGDPVEA